MRNSVLAVYRMIGGIADGCLLLSVHMLSGLLLKDLPVLYLGGDTLLWLVILFFWYGASLLTGLYQTNNWLVFSKHINVMLQTFLLMTIGLQIFQFWVLPTYTAISIAWLLFFCFVFLFTGRVIMYLLWQSVKVPFGKKILLIGEREGLNEVIESIRSDLLTVEIVACILIQDKPFIEPEGGLRNNSHERASWMQESVSSVQAVRYQAAAKEIEALPPVPRWSRINGQSVNDNMGIVQEGRLPDFQQVIAEAQRKNATEIYCTLSPERFPALYDLARMAEKAFIAMKFIPAPSGFMRSGILVDQLNGFPVLSLRSNPLEHPVNQLLKRSMDIVVSLLVIMLVLWWLIPILALLIRLDSPGPVFFVQARSGKKNRPFQCFKFRTLRKNNQQEARQVTHKDDRVTRVGRFLRKSNLDELPQFFNVLKGDMSLVGPRPHMLNHTERFNGMHAEYMVRHLVKPGVTGLAQINGFRGEIRSPDLLRKRVEYDIRYLENWSILEDIRILFATVWVSFRGDTNAY